MKNWQKKYPPYSGDEPYLFFAFADRDSSGAWKIMRILLERGIRVWYSSDTARSGQELENNQKKAAGAEATFLLLTDEAVSNKNLKSLILANQSAKKTVVAINPDGKDRLLAMNLKESVSQVMLQDSSEKTELADALCHAEGVTQSIIGEPVKVRRQWALPVVMCLLSAALLAIALRFAPEVVPQDTVFFSDPVTESAVRKAAGGLLTEETVARITELSFAELPGDWSELEKLPQLEKICLDQDAAMLAPDFPEGYVITLSGGDGA